MNYWKFIIAVIIIEIILAFVFSVISQVFYKKLGLDFRSIFKGMVERGFLFIALVNNFPHALTLFGALKVATRLKHTDKDADEENSFNNFYLIGNLISVMIAIGYVYYYKFFFYAII